MTTIRKAAQADLPILTDIYNQSVLHTTATFDLTPVTPNERQGWFDAHGGHYPLIVAEEKGVVMGYASLSSFRDKEAYNGTVELSVYIDEAHQGKGLGKLLMSEILHQAKELHYHVVISGITKGNDKSVQLHARFGFEFCGEFKQVGYKFDEWQDVLFYQLILNA
ncbi:GNAT family N-acetyltransferase [Priestia koreensis]|uniref:GNAT family N-acetyltransferase n=1 Tax=Priestia koreensis TaxID=284581 RepID=UPI003458B3F3